MTATDEEKRSKIVIRAAEGYDASRIARMLEEWFDQTMVGYPRPDPVEMTGWVLNTMAQGYVAVAERHGRLIGVLGISRSSMPWNRRVAVFRDQFFYVPPKHRHRGTAEYLMKAAQMHAAKQQIPLFMAIITGQKTDHLERWYRLKGGTYVGGIMTFGFPQKAVAAEG